MPAHEIHTIDLKFQDVPWAIAAYLVVGPSGPILIETGPASTLDTLRSELAALGYDVKDIRHVLVTHIHLDHAGALGWWAQRGAQVYVHHLGAGHMIDPSKLIASAERIYGDEMDRLWGQVLPAPVDQVTEVYDGDRLEVAGLTFTAIDSPGHAKHHLVFRLGDVAFTGDAAGVRLPGERFLDLPAPPPEFDLEVWNGTIDRLLAEKFSTIYPTHFGAYSDVGEHLEEFREVMARQVDWVESQLKEGLDREQLVERYQAENHERARQAGVDEVTLKSVNAANTPYMSVDGILRYLRKKAERQQA